MYGVKVMAVIAWLFGTFLAVANHPESGITFLVGAAVLVSIVVAVDEIKGN